MGRVQMCIEEGVGAMRCAACLPSWKIMTRLLPIFSTWHQIAALRCHEHLANASVQMQLLAEPPRRSLHHGCTCFDSHVVAALQNHRQCHGIDSLLMYLQGNKVITDPTPYRFPGTKASYHALLDVADNELVAEAQARQAAACYVKALDSYACILLRQAMSNIQAFSWMNNLQS